MLKEKQHQYGFSNNLPWILYNKYVPGLKQVGPKCGPVAVCMADHLQQSRIDKEKVEVIFQAAQRNGYTNHGEMLSADNMAQLAGVICGCEAEVLVGGMRNHFHAIVGHIVAGKPVLMPYDNGFDQEPCQKNGNRAHWALASGILLGLERGSVPKELYTQPIETLPWLCLPNDAISPFPVPFQQGLAKQGRSKSYRPWKLDEVAGSNEQLNQLDPDKDASEYVLPAGDLAVGLSGKVVLLHTRKGVESSI